MVSTARNAAVQTPGVTGGDTPQALRVRRRRRRRLSARQISAIQYVIHLFVDEDLERGVSAVAQIHCDACSCRRPRAGAIPYGEHLLCNTCAAEYEVADADRRISTIGEFIRDKHSGEAERYVRAPAAGSGPLGAAGDEHTPAPQEN